MIRELLHRVRYDVEACFPDLSYGCCACSFRSVVELRGFGESVFHLLSRFRRTYVPKNRDARWRELRLRRLELQVVYAPTANPVDGSRVPARRTMRPDPRLTNKVLMVSLNLQVVDPVDTTNPHRLMAEGVCDRRCPFREVIG